MTLLITCLLLSIVEAHWTAYFGAFVLWILHVAYHEETKK